MRECVVCGADLSGRKRHAKTCSGACRAEKSRAEKGSAPTRQAVDRFWAGVNAVRRRHHRVAAT